MICISIKRRATLTTSFRSIFLCLLVGLSAGAQAPQVTTQTSQKGDRDFDLRDFGGYATNNSFPQTIGSISAASTSLVLNAPLDFQNNQGIVIWRAGTSAATDRITTPGQATVTPIGLGGGSTTYRYQLIAESRKGALTAASTAGQTTTGQDKLGLNSVSLTSCVRSNGVATYTTTSVHNLTAATQVNITGYGLFDVCSGVKTIAATPTSTTFTTNDGQVADENNNTAATAQVYACNTLSFPARSYSGANTIRYWIYRSKNGGAYSVTGVAQGWDPFYIDCGLPAPVRPGYVPTTPLTSPQAGYLTTSIVSGAGTTTLTLANAASANVSGQAVLHDNWIPLRTAVAAALASGGGTVYVPNILDAPYWVFNSTMDFINAGLSFFSSSVRIHFNSSGVIFNQSLIPRPSMSFEGEPRTTTSFSYRNGTPVRGSAYPLILVPQGTSGNHFSRLQVLCPNGQQSCFYMDSGLDGGGPAGIVWDDVNFNGNGRSTPIILKGGFDFFFRGGVCSGGFGSTFAPVPCFQMTNASAAVTGHTTSQIPGRLKAEGMYFAGNSMQLDCNGSGGTTRSAPVDFIFKNGIFESILAPYLRLSCADGLIRLLAFDDIVTADPVAGIGTPVLDSQGDSRADYFSWTNGALANLNSPLLISGSSKSSILITNTFAGNPGNGSVMTISGSSQTTNASMLAYGNMGKIGYLLPTPAAPGVSVMAGGAVPVGSRHYQIQWIDIDGNFSAAGTQAIATVTTGQQTVTITRPTSPAGAAAWVAYRDGAMANIPGCRSIAISTTAIEDTSGSLCGNSLANRSATASVIDSAGILTYAMRLSSNGFTATNSFPKSLTNNRTFAVPDGNSALMLVGSFTTTASVSDKLMIQGVTASSHCLLTPTNASAATDSIGTWVGPTATNQVTVNHPSNAGRTWNIACTPN
jgi:hypothetical protein